MFVYSLWCRNKKISNLYIMLVMIFQIELIFQILITFYDTYDNQEKKWNDCKFLCEGKILSSSYTNIRIQSLK